VSTEDVVLEVLRVVDLGIGVVSRETLVVVGNIHATIRSTLHGSEDLGTSGSALDSNIQVCTEWLAVIVINTFNVVVLGVLASSLRDLLKRTGGVKGVGLEGPVDLFHARIHLVKTEVLEQAAGAQEAGGVRGRIVLQAGLQAVTGKLLGRSLAQDLVTLDLSGDNLYFHVTVGETNNKSILGGLVLVLVLGNELVASSIVGVTSCKGGSARWSSNERQRRKKLDYVHIVED